MYVLQYYVDIYDINVHKSSNINRNDINANIIIIIYILIYDHIHRCVSVDDHIFIYIQCICDVYAWK
jgi:hypothetical protein